MCITLLQADFNYFHFQHHFSVIVRVIVVGTCWHTCMPYFISLGGVLPLRCPSMGSTVNYSINLPLCVYATYIHVYTRMQYILCLSVYFCLMACAQKISLIHFPAVAPLIYWSCYGHFDVKCTYIHIYYVCIYAYKPINTFTFIYGYIFKMAVSNGVADNR